MGDECVSKLTMCYACDLRADTHDVEGRNPQRLCGVGACCVDQDDAGGRLFRRLLAPCAVLALDSVCCGRAWDQAGVWETGTALDELQQSILSAVEARRRLSGLDNLMTYFKDEVLSLPAPYTNSINADEVVQRVFAVIKNIAPTKLSSM